MTEATRVTLSKVWTIMQCDRSMGSHVITSIVASVQGEMHARTERGREDSRGEEGSSKSPVKL